MRPALIVLSLYGFCMGQAQTDTLPAHPRLLFNAEGIARLKARSQDPAWAAEWKAFQGRADASLKERVELPPRGSNWQHWYVCPTHGARLITGKRIGPWQWEHICSIGHEVWNGDPAVPSRDFDGCVLDHVHDGYAEQVRSDGILYQVTGDERYAHRGREILLAYAARYLSYPFHNTGRGEKALGGRLSPQTLDEATWLISATQGADLIWDTLSDTDRRAIADKLFLPAVRDVILPHRYSIPNIQCWENSSIGLTGLLLGDRDLIHTALDDPKYGYRVQMANGVRSDGFWQEGTWGYHYYTLTGTWPLVEAGRNSGIDLYGEPFKKMFEAPIQLAMPNMVVPAFNDGNERDIRNPMFELAYARYRDPLDLVGLSGLDRNNDFALWFGVDKLLPATPVALGSRNDTASGYAMLQRGLGVPATWLCLKYGPHGGAHGHPDKNTFILYSNGQTLFPDSGSRPYGSPLHAEWNKTTLAHNTLIVDQKSQRPATGASLAFGTDNGVDYAMTDAGDIYDGVRFVRTAVLLNQNLALFVDQIQADKTHTFDIACHYRGRWTKPVGTERPDLAAADGYQHLQNVGAMRTSDGATLLLEGEGGARAAIVLAGDEQTQVIGADGIGKSTEDPVPVAIFRRTGLQTTYVWAISLDGAPVKLKANTKSPGVAIVQVNSTWNVNVDRDHATVRVSR